jgi:tRNA (cmo5U34)-methyltransferase
MNSEEVKAIFDQQAAGYDRQWARMAPIRDNLHYLLEGVFVDLPAQARILCVGAGTGAEISYLARACPQWRFTAVDPSAAMLDVCRQRAQAEGFEARCDFHAGYLESLPASAPYDAATCFLVSQFILDRDARTGFFRGIANRLRSGGILASSDLASDMNSKAYDELLRGWFSLMTSAGVQPQQLERMRANYARDVGILPPAEVQSIIGAAGFAPPVQFFQAGLIHAWFARRN